MQGDLASFFGNAFDVSDIHNYLGLVRLLIFPSHHCFANGWMHHLCSLFLFQPCKVIFLCMLQLLFCGRIKTKINNQPVCQLTSCFVGHCTLCVESLHVATCPSMTTQPKRGDSGVAAMTARCSCWNLFLWRCTAAGGFIFIF